MMIFFRHSLAQRIITAFLLPLVLVALNGTGVALCIYEFEWEDILTHHYQHFDPTNLSNKALGREFITRVLENNKHGNDHTLPKPAATTPDLRAVPTVSALPLIPAIHHTITFTPRTQGFLLRGSLPDIFHPPLVL